MGKRLWLFLTICMFTVSMAFAQQKITGEVIDKSTGEPVVGAAVRVKGNTSVGAATDINGKFTITNLPADAKVLVVSYIGMVSTEAPARNNVRILMESDTKTLDETIVIAYGTMKKSSFTGSAAEIKSEDITNHIATSVTSALKNATAGVQMVSPNGDPANETNSIYIRGIGSMSSSNSPLIVLDGMPYDGALSSINPNNVESMTVLKDAAASAIYGARGANGVILITSKKGRKNDAEIHFDAKWGSNSRAIPRYDLINDPGQYYETAYRQLYNSYAYNGYSAAEAYKYADKALLDEKNGGLGYLVYTVPEGEKLIGTNFKLNPNATLGYSDGEYYYTPDDWYKETIHNAFRQEYNLSVSGASDRLNYFISGGFLDQTGIVNNSDYKRYTASSNLDYQVKKWLKIGSQLNYTHSDYIQPDYTTSSWASSGNIFYLVNNMGPIYPLYVRNADGSNKYNSNGLIMYDSNQTNQKRPGTVGNAVRDNEYDKTQTFRDMFTGNWSAIFTPLDGLALTARVGITTDNRRTNYLYSTFGNMTAYDGAAEVASRRMYSFNDQYLANYVTDFGTDGTHNLEVLGGYEQYKYKYQYLSGYRTHLMDPYIGELGNAYGPKDDMAMDSYTDNYMTEGFLGRLQYDYMEKYVFSASYRRDASSRFASGHRWGNFYSFGAAWNMAKESFLEEYDWIDLLKVKASYGEQGNDNLGSYYPYADMYTFTTPTGDAYPREQTQIANPELTWEKSKNFNIGVDFGLFKSRLSGSVEFFNRSTSDLLYYKDLPLSSGFGSLQMPINVGSIRNRGVELQLNATPISNRNFTWNISFNLTHYVNKITSLDSSVSEEGIKTSTRVYKVGGSLFEAYLYKFAGIYTEDNYCDETYNSKKAGMAMYYYEKKNKEVDAAGKPVLDADGNQKVYYTTERTTDFSSASQYDCGSVLPKIQGGLGMDFKLYDFDASFQLGYQFGGRFYDSQYQALMHTDSQGIGSSWHKDALDSWSETNPNSSIHRLDTSYSVGQSAVDMYQTTSNYLSINNVTIGYTLPKVMASRIGLGSLRVYVAGENLWVFSARKGLDPRFGFGIGGYTSGAGYASGNYSVMRTIAGGITLTF